MIFYLLYVEELKCSEVYTQTCRAQGYNGKKGKPITEKQRRTKVPHFLSSMVLGVLQGSSKTSSLYHRIICFFVNFINCAELVAEFTQSMLVLVLALNITKSVIFKILKLSIIPFRNLIKEVQ